MVEGIFGFGGEPHLIDEFGAEQLVEQRLDAEFGEQVRPEAGADHRCRAQRPSGRGSQPVDARFDGGLDGGRHAHIGDVDPADVISVVPTQQAPLRQFAHHLLGEERVPGGPLGDDRGQFGHRWVATE